MRFEPPRAFAKAQPLASPAPRLDSAAVDLPPEIAFLRHYHVCEASLQRAALRARTERTCAAWSLVAEGEVSAALYYRALAHYLGLAFVADWPQVEPIFDPAAAHRSDRIGLADDARGGWLLAPTGPDLLVLLDAYRLGLKLPNLAITTPAHLSAIIRHRAEDAVEHAASDALPDAMPRLSAKGAANRMVGIWVCSAAILCLVGIFLAPRVNDDFFCLLFFAGIVFRLIVCAAGLAPPMQEDRRLLDSELPFYTILVPLHREAEIVPKLVAALSDLDYPSAKLEILMLVEPEDTATRIALAAERLPPKFRVIVAPDRGSLQTKPRALNIGLMVARGSLLTVYDAEDCPDLDQLRRAAARFADAPDTLACLQARLAMGNGEIGLLPRLFAIEYAALFDIYNVGTTELGLPLALGGTSNHFRTSALRAVRGWDAWNVTEDADLGLRLARLGYKVAALNSTTVETAPTKVGVWMKQRRRWTKGWMQTFLVLFRDGALLRRQLGWRKTAVIGLMATNLVLGPLLLPVFCGVVARDLVVHGLPRPHHAIELFEATLTVSVLLLGPAATLWSAWSGTRARDLGRYSSALPLILPYQLMISLAAWMGLIDLIRRPYHWHKTPH